MVPFLLEDAHTTLLEAFVRVVLWPQGDDVLISACVFNVRAIILWDGAEARVVITLRNKINK